MHADWGLRCWLVNRPPPDKLLEFLAPFTDDVVEVALALRARVLESLPNMHEVVWDATNAVTVVYTPTTRWQDGLCHTPAYSRHVNLGFNDGAGLSDPLGILVGTGARVRHVTMRTRECVARAWVPDYLLAAANRAGVPSDAGDGGLTVRRSAGPKRRPS